MSNTEIAGKIALVTGASRGIGQGIALTLASEGVKVIGTATSPEGAGRITAYLREAGYIGEGKVLDVRNTDQLKQFINEIKTSFGPVDILVNNAGIAKDNLAMRMKIEQWEEVIETNLSAVFFLTQLCLSDMLRARWGRIINIGSIVGTIGNPGQANYAAAKAGLLGMMKSIAQEVASRNITVNTVAPGFIETDMTKQLNEKLREELLSKIPLKRVGLPDDVAQAVLFLASNNASYITGQTLHVNGGLCMF